jgi:glucosamine--fructose-6-phosphate aminotransferase (isomerizing)
MDALAEVPDRIAEALTRAGDVDAVAHKLVGARDFFFLGRNVGYPAALEGALKLKEISYLRAEGYPAGELKHGPIALIEPGTVVVAVATWNQLSEKLLSNVAEVKSRGATVVAVASDGDEQVERVADHTLWVPATEDLFSPMVAAVPLELLAYRLAKLLGHDVDRPRNLAKTVTVE